LSSSSLRRWEYRETESIPEPSMTLVDAVPAMPMPTAPPGLTEEQVTVRIQEALQAEEQRWTIAAEQLEGRRRTQFETAMQSFAAERTRYFRQAETEVVHLALAIARKILDREAELDPALLHALVRIALDRMEAGPSLKLRVPPADMSAWQRGEAFSGSVYQVEVIADPSLNPGDCVVETDLGTANFGFDAQFKQIEQGILDLLRLRPDVEAAQHAPEARPSKSEGSET
jgi:flagellar assembly protein FliH